MQHTTPQKAKTHNAARDVRRGYPLDWPIRSWFVRVVRARNRCEWCGARNHQPHPATGSRVVLTTAHVYDRAPAAASLLNLAALCQRCHLNHDRAQHLHSRRANKDRANGQLSLFGVPSTEVPPQDAVGRRRPGGVPFRHSATPPPGRPSSPAGSPTK